MQRASWTPVVYFSLVSLAQLAVFWFEAYRILSLTFLILCVPLLFSRPHARAWPSAASKVLWSFIGVYSYMVIAILWAPRPSDAISEIAKTFAISVPPFLFGLAIARRYNFTNIARGVSVIPLIFFLQVLFNIYTYDDAMRIDQFNLRTQVGGLICLILPILLARYFASHTLTALGSLSIALVLALILAEQSRSTVLIVVPALMLVVRAHSRTLFKVSSLGLIALFVSMVFIIASGGSVGRFSSEDTSFEISDAVLDELAQGNQDGVDLERRAHTFIAASLFLDNPLFGAGYSAVLQSFIDQMNLEVLAHGFIPGMLAELGIIGIALISYFVWRMFKLIKALTSEMTGKVRIMGVGYAVSFGSIIAFGFFHQTFEWAYFPLLVGIILGASKLPKRAHQLQ